MDLRVFNSVSPLLETLTNTSRTHKEDDTSPWLGNTGITVCQRRETKMQSEISSQQFHRFGNEAVNPISPALSLHPFTPSVHSILSFYLFIPSFHSIFSLHPFIPSFHSIHSFHPFVLSFITPGSLAPQAFRCNEPSPSSSRTNS